MPPVYSCPEEPFSESQHAKLFRHITNTLQLRCALTKAALLNLPLWTLNPVQCCSSSVGPGTLGPLGRLCSCALAQPERHDKGELRCNLHLCEAKPTRRMNKNPIWNKLQDVSGSNSKAILLVKLVRLVNLQIATY